MTIHERLPIFMLGILAWFVPILGNKLALSFTFILLIWQGLGGGVTATAWQSLIGKIIPSSLVGTFFGIQTAAANLFASVTAVLAGYLLEKYPFPLDFMLCFLAASVAMIISWYFLSLTKEKKSIPQQTDVIQGDLLRQIGLILKRDKNFRNFLVARTFAQFGTMAYSFYTLYLVKQHGLGESIVGVMTAFLMGSQIIVSPVMGWIGDRRGHRFAMEICMLCALFSTTLAWWAAEPVWFYLVFILAGISGVALWTLSMAMTLKFGREADRPVYIGLANTLIAPSAILAPLLAGWLVDITSFQIAFIISAIGALLTVGILHYAVHDPVPG